MIIQALYDYYNTLLNDPEIEIAKPGYSLSKVKFVATLSKDGDLLDLTSLAEGKTDWIELIVPEQKKRSGSNPIAYFLCDNSKFVFGWSFDAKNSEMTIKNFEAFKNLHKKILEDVHNAKSRAIMSFLQSWDPEKGLANEVIKGKLADLSKAKGGNIVFQLDCESGYIHLDQAILKAWGRYNAESESDAIGQCLVTGDEEPLERVHLPIKGVRDAQSAGASLVSAHARAFESYIQKNSAMSLPVSKTAAFGYATVLNYMLNNPKHRIQLADATTVFWAEETGGECEDLLGQLIDPVEEEREKSGNDPVTTAYVKDALQCLREGKPIREKADVNFCILGLSPNNARLAVRFWHKDHFGRLVQKVWQHHEDMQIVNLRQEMIPLRRLIFETIPRNAQKKEAAPLLGGALMQSVFTGRAYPQGLFYAIINRIRADGEINDIRVAIIKAILKRNARLQKDEIKERVITVSLNEQNPSIAYRLGRLFAVLEKAQQDAAEVKLNSTIKDRYFGTASASPRSVFPVLMKLTQHHISKVNKFPKHRNFDKLIQGIVQGINEFPAHLNAEEQGLFILGYYHQREDLYKPNQSNTEEE